ncbi:hypothetical protein ABOZ73_06645 [Caulobacter sp. 73W]|uniref:DUF1508 domain-containing protein n=1 Tax=Caulobacter sp. 73W TaxID=3161137 RepID=A0AB39KXU5_9CAUL
MLGERFSLFVVHAEGWRWTLVAHDGAPAAGGQALDLDTALEDARASAAAFTDTSSHAGPSPASPAA